jgi:hypothetical protein
MYLRIIPVNVIYVSCITKWEYVGFEVLTAVVMKSTIFWDITPCSPLSVNSQKMVLFKMRIIIRRFYAKLLNSNTVTGQKLNSTLLVVSPPGAMEESTPWLNNCPRHPSRQTTTLLYAQHLNSRGTSKFAVSSPGTHNASPETQSASYYRATVRYRLLSIARGGHESLSYKSYTSVSQTVVHVLLTVPKQLSTVI